MRIFRVDRTLKTIYMEWAEFDSIKIDFHSNPILFVGPYQYLVQTDITHYSDLTILLL